MKAIALTAIALIIITVLLNLITSNSEEIKDEPKKSDDTENFVARYLSRPNTSNETSKAQDEIKETRTRIIGGKKRD